eukprot:s2815_g4.t1
MVQDVLKFADMDDVDYDEDFEEADEEEEYIPQVLLSSSPSPPTPSRDDPSPGDRNEDPRERLDPIAQEARSWEAPHRLKEKGDSMEVNGLFMGWQGSFCQRFVRD